MTVDDHLPLTHLSFLILMALAERPRHGYSIIKSVQEMTEGRVSPGTGTFYSALQRMRDEELLDEAPAPEGVDRRRRYYDLTELGRRVLRAEARRLDLLLSQARRRKIIGQGEAG